MFKARLSYFENLLSENDMINMWPKQPIYALGNQLSQILEKLSKLQTFFSN